MKAAEDTSEAVMTSTGQRIHRRWTGPADLTLCGRRANRRRYEDHRDEFGDDFGRLPHERCKYCYPA